ncbi:MAG: hypothetical protein U1E76_23085 [Planctomycetota bacterium]
MPTWWFVYFFGDDLEAKTLRSAQLGAKVCMQTTAIPDIGRCSLLTDPTGAMFALFFPTM